MEISDVMISKAFHDIFLDTSGGGHDAVDHGVLA